MVATVRYSFLVRFITFEIVAQVPNSGDVTLIAKVALLSCMFPMPEAMRLEGVILMQAVRLTILTRLKFFMSVVVTTIRAPQTIHLANNLAHN